MNRYRKDMQERKVLTKALPAVTRTNLEDWKIIKKTNEGYLASNAFVLLTSDYYQFSKTQCAVFKGNDRVVFLDKREFKGPLYSQIEDSIDFVLRNIRLGAKIEGLIRKEDYELPIEAIREMIVNAHCHRNMTDESCVQVAVFDDRLEVTSPGGFYNGLTFEEAMQGHSKLRNRAIANVFSQIGLIEAWGTGFKRIRNAAKEYGLPDPEFIEMPEMFRVNLYRKPMTSVGNASAKVGNDVGNVGNDVGNVGEQFSEKSVEDSDLKASIMNLISADSKVLSSEIAKQLSVSQRTVERHIKQLREDGQIIRHGSRTRGGYWEVTTTIHTTLK